jgi:hypothetical protein
VLSSPVSLKPNGVIANHMGFLLFDSVFSMYCSLVQREIRTEKEKGGGRIEREK